jgi:CRISPR-associated endonuclease/helicase Cas3
MALSATARAQLGASENNSFELTDLERNPPAEIPDQPTEPVHVVWRRLKARKALQFVSVLDEKREMADKIASLVLEDKFRLSGRAILIFVQTVESVEKLFAKLDKEKQQVQQLTGTLRGLERDRMADPRRSDACRIFARFLKPPKPDAPENERWRIDPMPGSVYLVCTSAGEVGVNISADHLVCDLTTFESMAQRFGRVNRFGDRKDTEIHIVHPEAFDEKDAYDQARKNTLELLKQLPGDASPAALGRLDPKARLDAFAPMPIILPVTDILFDSWAMTTIRSKLAGRPPVEPYLHGIADWQPPETHVAWRQEVGIITDELRERYPPEDLLEDYPLKPHELLRDRSDRVFKHLTAIAERDANQPVWLVDDFGNVEQLTLAALANKENKNRINYRTIVLAPDAGGLKNGLLSGGTGHSDVAAYDVADEWFLDKDRSIRRRIRVWDDEKLDEQKKCMRLVRTIDTRPDAGDFKGEETETTERRFWYWYCRPRDTDDDLSRTATEPIRWDHHTRDVTENVERIVTALNLPPNLRQAVIVAAKFHDLGKKRISWQRSIGNPNPTNWHAKSGRDPATGRLWKPVDITTYRHEFGSLLDLLDDEQPHYLELRTLIESVEDMRELVLHLIAAHHGRGRPHFPADEAFDPERPQREADTLASEVPRRFARLQRKYGRWGLAYLESLLRAADYAASANPSPKEGER